MKHVIIKNVKTGKEYKGQCEMYCISEKHEKKEINNYTPRRDMRELCNIIGEAISKGRMDKRIIGKEKYLRPIFGCNYVEIKQGLPLQNVRNIICELYADYCDLSCHLFVRGKKRNDLYLGFLDKIKKLYDI